MGVLVQARRGTREELLSITPDAGELCWTTDTQEYYMGDGSTPGGIKIGGEPTTSDWTVYVATSALGATAGGSGLQLKSGTTTGTTASKLIDSGGGFTSAAHLNKAVYNSTDDTWAKITAVDSSTQLSVSADIFVSGEAYRINDAITTIALAANAVENPFFANPTIRISPGTFPDDYEFVGINPAGAFSLTLQGSTTSTTTLSGEGTCRQRINISNITQTGRFFLRAGSDITWTACTTSGDDGFVINTLPNLITNAFSGAGNTIIFESDPGAYTNEGSTITIGYDIYVATSALGGSDSNDGLLITQGSATSASSNQLIDSTANFNDADHLGMTVYNTTDDTWAEATSITSSTQIALDADIMASGENYEIVAAKLTVQGGIDEIPGSVNSDTTVRISNGTFTEVPVLNGKVQSGNFDVNIIGTLVLQETAESATVAAGTGATRGTVTKVAQFTGDTWDDYLAYFATDAEYRVIESNTNDALTLIGTAPSSTTQDVSVYGWGTIITSTEDTATANRGTLNVEGSQQGSFLTNIKVTNTSGTVTDWAISVQHYSTCTLTNVWHIGRLQANASTVFYNKCVVDGTGFLFALVGTGSIIESKYTNFFGDGTDFGILVQHGSKWYMRFGTTIDNFNIGFWAGDNGASVMENFTSTGYLFIKNNTTYGVQAKDGGIVRGTANNQYSGNGTDEFAVAASFGYID